MKKYIKVIITFSIITMFFCIANINQSYAALTYPDRIYQGYGNSSRDVTNGLQGIMTDAEEFEKTNAASLGTGNYNGQMVDSSFTLNTSQLKNLSSMIYTAFIIVATAICVIVGLIIGIKFMTGSIETQVETKKLLKPYLIGCFVIFGAVGIWTLAVNILSNI